MSDTVLVIAIVVPAMLMATLGIVGLLLARELSITAKSGSNAARFQLRAPEDRETPSKPTRPRQAPGTSKKSR